MKVSAIAPRGRRPPAVAGAALALVAVCSFQGASSAAPAPGHVRAADPMACTIVGTEGIDMLAGTPGDDVICGLDGSDWLFSSPGDDTFVGGDGVDQANFSTSPGPVRVSLSTGVATGDGTDTLVGMEEIEGSDYRDVIKGSDGNNNFLSGGLKGDLIVGRGGDDFLRGGRGNDTLIPGLGDDLNDGGAGIDVVSFKFSATPVTVDLQVSLATGEGHDSAYVENVIGSPFADSIAGGIVGVPNVLSGQAGDDTLAGLAGDDKLYGQAGDDNLDGGTGTDLCHGGSGTDTASACETVMSVP